MTKHFFNLYHHIVTYNMLFQTLVQSNNYTPNIDTCMGFH